MWPREEEGAGAQYQLVLQLPVASLQDYDRLIELEDRLIDYLGNSAKVDGHDAGMGEGNIFIYTNDALATFELIRTMQGIEPFLPRLKAAYRQLSREDYIVIHPSDLKSFAVQ